MTIKEFKNKAISTSYNTCNSWGFAGNYGTVFSYNDFKFYQIRFSTRHQGSYNNYKYYFKDVIVDKRTFENELRDLN